uniref:Eukaryotic translation initiation factor 3 subunit 3 n=1 Tax=Arundo donax TaxID=35708 RepID=A0A0A9DXH3_ARUDO
MKALTSAELDTLIGISSKISTHDIFFSLNFSPVKPLLR